MAAALLAGCAAIFTITISSPQTAAQTLGLERNLPPVPAGGGGLAIGTAPFATDDDTPLGVTLQGIVLFGAGQPIETGPRPGLSFDAVEGAAKENLKAALKPFLGKPLSRKLIADSQAAVAHIYRGAGHPFVSVTVPPQEITTGTLWMRVIPFRTGKVKVADNGSETTQADAVLAASVRAPAGELIEADQIAEDLDWINRYPYRQLNGVFEPGSSPGSSDLTLEVSRGKPWQVYAGAANSGNKGTGRMRYFAGVGFGSERLGDLTASYQLTASDDFLSDPLSARLSGTRWPSYLSHAGRLVLPLSARQSVEIAPSFVATRQEAAGGLLTFQNTALELPLLYRSALSNLAPSLAGWGEIYGGITPRWLSRKTRFQGLQIADGNAGVLDFISGWAGTRQEAGGVSTSLDLRLVANPGGILPGNTGGTWSAFSNGRMESVRYAYLYGTLTQATPLAALPHFSDVAALRNLSLNTTLVGQLAGQALPDTEQLSLGGYYAIRGYGLDDGSVDTGFVLRNDLRLPAVSLLGQFGASPDTGASNDRLQPYAFFDLGYGHSYTPGPLRGAQKADSTLASIGTGVDYTVTGNVQASVLAGVALTNGLETRRGGATAQARLTVSF